MNHIHGRLGLQRASHTFSAEETRGPFDPSSKHAGAGCFEGHPQTNLMKLTRLKMTSMNTVHATFMRALLRTPAQAPPSEVDLSTGGLLNGWPLQKIESLQPWLIQNQVGIDNGKDCLC